jgi:hypothetical protein
MAPKKTPTPKRSAAYYRTNPEAYAKKLAYDTKENGRLVKESPSKNRARNGSNGKSTRK